MSAKTLIAIGITWVGVVALWLRHDQSFGLYWRRPTGATRQAAIVAAIYASLVLYQVFLIGWILPLSLGAYRLVKKH
jgi:hypothetical protein